MFLVPWSCLLQKEMKMITTLLVYFTDSKHNVIRSHFFLNGHITIAIAGLSISGSILLPSSLMMPLFHAHSSSPTTLSVPVTANSHQFPAIYVCIEILDYMFHLLYPSPLLLSLSMTLNHKYKNNTCAGIWSFRFREALVSQTINWTQPLNLSNYYIFIF